MLRSQGIHFANVNSLIVSNKAIEDLNASLKHVLTKVSSYLLKLSRICFARVNKGLKQ